ncbi:MAG: cupin domain-containing protein [Eubacteriales bacterium]|nr:cupin domain-containing protein [Eubacteriales bacterium]
MEKVYQYTITDKEIFENIFKDEKLLMNHVIIPPGKVFPKHPTDAIVYALVIHGELSVTIENNAPKAFKAGCLVNIPKGASTELGNRGDEYLELFVVKYEYDLP